VELVNKFKASILRERTNTRSNSYKWIRIPINYRTPPQLFLVKVLTDY
jgi:hypothetical protein